MHGVGTVAAGRRAVVDGGDGPAGALDDQHADVGGGFEVFERVAGVVDVWADASGAGGVARPPPSPGDASPGVGGEGSVAGDAVVGIW